MSLCILFPFTTVAQNPYRVAGDHYHLILENKWVRATRVTYAPGEVSPVHDHPQAPAIISVYVTDSGVMRIRHFNGDLPSHAFDRQPVKAGAVRLAPGSAEIHAMDYLGESPLEYITLELRIGTPLEKFEWLPPVWLNAGQSAAKVQYENEQVRVVRISCALGEHCPGSSHPKDPAIVVVLTGPQKGDVKWLPRQMEGPMQQVRFELKTLPAAANAESK